MQRATSSNSINSFSSDTVFAMEGVSTPASRSKCPSIGSALDAWAGAVIESRSSQDSSPLVFAIDQTRRRIMACARDQAEQLDLSGLDLPCLPPVLNELTHVRKLNLANNRLTDYPAELDEMHWLHAIDLSGNRISGDGKGLSLGNLVRNINLNHNPITRLPESITGLIRRGARVTCQDTKISLADQESIATELGEAFPEDLFQPAWMAMSSSARKASFSRNSSENWDPALHRPRDTRML